MSKKGQFKHFAAKTGKILRNLRLAEKPVAYKINWSVLPIDKARTTA